MIKKGDQVVISRLPTSEDTALAHEFRSDILQMDLNVGSQGRVVETYIDGFAVVDFGNIRLNLPKSIFVAKK